MKFKVINAGKCMLCGKPIKIIDTKDNDLFPNVFFCPKCEKKARENKLKAESEEKNADSN